MKVYIPSRAVSVTQRNRTYLKVVTFVSVTVCGILLVKEWALIRGNQSAGQHFPCPEVFKVFGPDARRVEVSKQRYPSFSSVVPGIGGGGGFAFCVIPLFPDIGTLFRRFCV